MIIDRVILVPKRSSKNVFIAIQGEFTNTMSFAIADMDVFRRLGPQDACKSQSTYKKMTNSDAYDLLKPGSSFSFRQHLSEDEDEDLLYPVRVTDSDNLENISFEINYSFDFVTTLEMLNRKAWVKRKDSRRKFRIRWCPEDPRSIFWYDTRDGWLPYTMSREDCSANDWGVVMGFE